MYDEKHPPKEGLEVDIITVVKTHGPCTMSIIIEEVEKLGKEKISEITIRQTVWHLADRGFVEWTEKRKFKIIYTPLSLIPNNL